MTSVLTVGLTGGVAAGKSTVARWLAGWGAVVVDADAVVHELLGGPTATRDAVVARFGERVLDATGRIDRAALSALVFADAGARAALEAIVHPAVRAEIAARLARVRDGNRDAVFVVEAALLVEAGTVDAYDVLVVVDAPIGVRVARQGAVRDAAAAHARVAAQASGGRKALAADVVVWNDSDLETLEERAREVWRHLRDRLDGAGSLAATPPDS